MHLDQLSLHLNWSNLACFEFLNLQLPYYYILTYNTFSIIKLQLQTQESISRQVCIHSLSIALNFQNLITTFKSFTYVCGFLFSTIPRPKQRQGSWALCLRFDGLDLAHRSYVGLIMNQVMHKNMGPTTHTHPCIQNIYVLYSRKQ